ncbi:hypothetical protein CK203_091702 [Vitis vinifera]|uniref:Sieve element occlusion C-terminal domain-containing protein n=1 Tax=Vitis vinifera TaxID=29760 RepID=A0A438D1R5_VITVI|nr:hypothetical protein CK203_091702 [Vitis vinifera]
MLYSKMRLGQTVEKDPTMQEILKMLSFDNSHEGWALLKKGFPAGTEGSSFANSPPTSLQSIRAPCCCWMIPETLVCSECGRKMEKFFVYRCCDVYSSILGCCFSGEDQKYLHKTEERKRRI